jgi:hypothetical protein
MMAVTGTIERRSVAIDGLDLEYLMHEFRALQHIAGMTIEAQRGDKQAAECLDTVRSTIMMFARDMQRVIGVHTEPQIIERGL